MKLVEETVAKLFRPPRILFIGDATHELRKTAQQRYECDTEIAVALDEGLNRLEKNRYDLVLIACYQPVDLSAMVAAVKNTTADTPLLVIAHNMLSSLVNALDSEVLILRSASCLDWDRLFRMLRLRVKPKSIRLPAKSIPNSSLSLQPQLTAC